MKQFSKFVLPLEFSLCSFIFAQIGILKSMPRNNIHLCSSVSECKPASTHVAGHDWQIPTHSDPIYYKAA